MMCAINAIIIVLAVVASYRSGYPRIGFCSATNNGHYTNYEAGHGQDSLPLPSLFVGILISVHKDERGMGHIIEDD